ncbi:MAG: tryptophan 2,3-dioxygenase [Polyangiaceae bacterium]|nr:tryptophan 2,3-dioxygenase [Polyangiaceae bacterium]
MNYWDYIRVEQLLALQGGIGDDESKLTNDEVVFITVHQVYELWFKLALREIVQARNVFHQNPVPDVQLSAAVRSFKRIVTIFEQAASHFKVVETLTTRDYLEFRDQLIPASGFQSAQVREVEVMLGLEDATRVPLGKQKSFLEALKGEGGKPSSALVRVQKRMSDRPTLKEAVYEWLTRTPIYGGSHSEQGTIDFLRAFLNAHKKDAEARMHLAMTAAGSVVDADEIRARYEREMAAAEAFLFAEDDPAADVETKRKRRDVRAAAVFLESYRELPRLAWAREVIDCLLELEQAIIIWRQRHARMVERVIGRRVGTGGSSGVDYLDETALRYRVFNDLWGVRALLLRAPILPPVEHEEAYRFRVEDKSP